MVFSGIIDLFCIALLTIIVPLCICYKGHIIVLTLLMIISMDLCIVLYRLLYCLYCTIPHCALYCITELFYRVLWQMPALNSEAYAHMILYQELFVTHLLVY